MDIQRIIDSLQHYDVWIHSKIMHPLSRWMQSWFHCNRFQLIQIALVVEGLAVAIKAISPSTHSITVHGPSLSLLMTTVLRAHYCWHGLSRASIDFEEGVVPSKAVADLLPIIAIARFGRIFALNLAGSWEIVYPLLWATGLRHLDAWELCLNVFIATWFIEFHLWDVDDVPPKDRKRLLNPAELPT